MKSQSETTKTDPDAPLTVPELLAMSLHYRGQPLILAQIDAALSRRTLLAPARAGQEQP